MSFDRLAPWYRTMERLLAGGKLQRCRLAWLPQVPEAQSVLLAGEGHGRFIPACADRFPQARLTCVDASRSMLKLAERQWRRAGGLKSRCDFVHAELPSWRPSKGAFDLVVTHFFLDCFPPDPLHEVVARLAEAAAPRAQWLLADFAVPRSGWRRRRAQLILALAYGFFQRTTALPARRLTTPDPFLKHYGFRLNSRVESEWGLLHSDLWERS